MFSFISSFSQEIGLIHLQGNTNQSYNRVASPAARVVEAKMAAAELC